MSREKLVAEVEGLAKIHEKNRLAYRKAKDAATTAAATVRAANDVASTSANALAEAREALPRFDRRNAKPARVVTGEGAPAAGAAAVGK